MTSKPFNTIPPLDRKLVTIPVYGAPSQPRQPPFVRHVEPLSPTAAQAVREQVERLVALRLSPTITSPADRAELDSIIGALTVAVAS